MGWQWSKGAWTPADLWCGDIQAGYVDGSVDDDGDLGEATTPGTGFGVVLANVPTRTAERCTRLGEALARAYDGRPLPSGEPGRLDFWVGRALR